ncbi:hypothetical protein RhiTH_010639 [Rhizoctonia solani]
MGCASSDNKYNIEVEDEEEDQTLPQAQPRGLQTLVSAQTNVFELVGNSQVTLSSNLMLFADGCCEEFGLADALKEDVLQTAKLPPQFLLTCLYARTVAFGKHVQNTKVDSFLTSREFKETVTRRLQAGLLDPYITRYVDGTTARFVRHIIENPASYEIPMAVQAQFMHSKLFSSAIQRSVIEGEDIVTLSSKLAIHGFQMGKDHILRIAFLRDYYIDFTTKNNAKTAQLSNDNKTETKFWSFVDAKLEKLMRKSLNDRLQSLDCTLAKDKRRFTAPKAGAPAILSKSMPEWQASVSHAISTMTAYQNSSPPIEEHPSSNTGGLNNAQPQESPSVSESGADPSSPIQEPEFEQDKNSEVTGSGQASGNMPLQYDQQRLQQTGRGVEINVQWATDQASSSERLPLANTAIRTGSNSNRRVTVLDTGLRGEAVRYNPLGTSGRLSTASPTPPPSHPVNTRVLRPRITGSIRESTSGPSPSSGTQQHPPENTQYDPHTSETGRATLGFY